jgi:hypothetical protein
MPAQTRNAADQNAQLVFARLLPANTSNQELLIDFVTKCLAALKQNAVKI